MIASAPPAPSLHRPRADLPGNRCADECSLSSKTPSDQVVMSSDGGMAQARVVGQLGSGHSCAELNGQNGNSVHIAATNVLTLCVVRLSVAPWPAAFWPIAPCPWPGPCRPLPPQLRPDRSSFAGDATNL